MSYIDWNSQIASIKAQQPFDDERIFSWVESLDLVDKNKYLFKYRKSIYEKNVHYLCLQHNFNELNKENQDLVSCMKRLRGRIQNLESKHQAVVKQLKRELEYQRRRSMVLDDHLQRTTNQLQQLQTQAQTHINSPGTNTITATITNVSSP